MTRAFPALLSREQVRQFDRIAIEEFGIESLVLMENAARGATDVLCELASETSAVILCGPGNNGGDGLVMTRHLHLRGWKTKVILLTDRQKITQDSTANLRILAQTSVPIVDGSEFSGNELENQLQGFAWIVDAMLGTGAKPPLRPPLDEFVAIANRQPCRRMAVDIPSGLDCDSDQAEAGNGAIFNADLTVTFVAMKPVMRTDTGKAHCGETRIVDIGAPPEVFDRLDD